MPFRRRPKVTADEQGRIKGPEGLPIIVIKEPISGGRKYSVIAWDEEEEEEIEIASTTRIP
jgi:hypothetical protein